MLFELLKTIEASVHKALCEHDFKGQAQLQQCLENFVPFFRSNEVYDTWAPVAGSIIWVSYVGYHLWIQGVLTLRHLALFGRPGILLISIIAIVTISSWLYAMNATSPFVDFETLSIIILVSAPFIVLYISNIFNANYRILAETSAERRFKMNILLFAQLAIILAATTLMVTSLIGIFVGLFLIIISPRLRAQIHERWGI